MVGVPPEMHENTPLQSMQKNSSIVLKVIHWENKLELWKEGASSWQYSGQKYNALWKGSEDCCFYL